MATASDTATRWLSLWLMAGVLLLGVALIVRELNTRSLWVDEGWSVAVSSQPGLADVTRMVADDVHPPLHLYLLHIWQRAAGDTVFALRLLSMLMVSVSAALVYRLGRELFGAATGVLAALLFVLHDLIQVLGGEIRKYPQSQLLTVLVIGLYWRFWQVQNPRRGIAFALAGMALLWTNYWGGLVLALLGIHMLVSRWPHVKPALLAFGAIAVAFVPWLPVVFQQIGDIGAPGLGHALPASRTGYEVLAYQLLGRPEWLWGLLALAGMFDLRARRWQPTAAGALLGLVVIGIVALSIAINLVYATLSFRMLSIVIPALVVLIARAIIQTHARVRPLLAALAIFLTVVLPGGRHPVHLPWDDVARFVAAHSAAGDGVLIETWFDTYAFTYYLERASDDLTTFPSELEQRNRSTESFAAYVDAALADHDGVWVVRFSPKYEIGPRVEAGGLVQTGQIMWETPLSPIELLRFDRLSQSPPLTVFGDALYLDEYTVTVRDDLLTLKLLWQPVRSSSVDYTVSVFLLNGDGVLMAQNDSFPLANHSATSSWRAGGHYFDSHALPTADLPAGTYQLGLKVYAFTDNSFETIEILSPETCAPDCEFMVLEQVEIGSGGVSLE